MDASAGLIITAVLASLLCLRRRRCPEATAAERQEKMAVLMQCEVERSTEA